MTSKQFSSFGLCCACLNICLSICLMALHPWGAFIFAYALIVLALCAFIVGKHYANR